MARLQAGNIGVDVFQSESKLVAIDPFRPPSKLGALEAPNDQLESVDLGLRLGEASGAATAVPLLRLACALHNGMATFEQAGVSTA